MGGFFSRVHNVVGSAVTGGVHNVVGSGVIDEEHKETFINTNSGIGRYNYSVFHTIMPFVAICLLLLYIYHLYHLNVTKGSV
jgi:hypothetical protein